MGRIKRKAKNGIKKILRAGLEDQLLNISKELSMQRSILEDMHSKIGSHDFRLDELKRKVQYVEQYQPIYGITGIIDTPARQSEDRCNAISDSLGDVVGARILDLGSSLGYISFFFADRGAFVDGWESNPQNAEIARLISQINGIQANFLTKELNSETVSSIPTNYYDVAVVLSVFHHIIRFQGLDKTKEIVANLLAKVPVMIVELAKKGEDPKLPWDKDQPNDELAIFGGLDVTITKIGSFGNHLSNKKRPLYRVEAKKVVTVNKKIYLIEDTTRFAYPNSPVLATELKRQYLKTKNDFLKVYFFNKENKDNTQQIINEINFFNSLQRMSKNHPTLPVMKDFEVGADKAVIVFQKIDGELADQSKQKTKNLGIDKIFGDIFNCLVFMESVGYYHNDLRSWNIMVTDASVKLIDFGLVSTKQTENNAVAFLWALHAMATSNRESYAQNKKILPPKKVFESKTKLSRFYELVKAGEDSFISIRKQLVKKPAKPSSDK